MVNYNTPLSSSTSRVTCGMSPKASTTCGPAQGLDFSGMRPTVALDDGARVAEARAALGRLAADEGDDGLGHLAGRDDLCDALFLRAADLAEHHDGFRLWIGLKELDDFGIGEAHDRVPAHVHECGRADPGLAQIVCHRGRDASGARGDAHRAGLEPLARGLRSPTDHAQHAPSG